MANPYVPSAESSLQKLERVLAKYEITIADANDLVALQDYDIVLVLDDSGSMATSSVPPEHRKLGVRDPTRWDELGETVRAVVELATCFDEDGVDVHFLNRPMLSGVKSAEDNTLAAALAAPPRGTTPLTETLTTVIGSLGNSEKPILFLIATDGVPNGGPGPFKRVIEAAINKQSTTVTMKFQILACTADDASVGWLNEFDGKYDAVDVTDDYYSERAEVMKTGRCPAFTRADWIIKALLGPVSTKFDAWDEKHRSPAYVPQALAHPSPNARQPAGAHKPPAKKKDDGCCTVL